jgi:hypothetical protein
MSHQKFIEVTCTRPESIALDSHLLEQRNEEIAQRRLLAALLRKEQMPPVLETSSCEDNRQVRVRMRAGVPHAASENYGGVIQQRAATDVLHRGESFEEVIQLD